jgi:uncharacterized membrane protein YeiH
MLTGIGGGMLRDLLVNEIPTVLQGELYAVAARAGAAVVVAGHVLHLPPTVPTMIGGAVLTVGSVQAGTRENVIPDARRGDPVRSSQRSAATPKGCVGWRA